MRPTWQGAKTPDFQSSDLNQPFSSPTFSFGFVSHPGRKNAHLLGRGEMYINVHTHKRDLYIHEHISMLKYVCVQSLANTQSPEHCTQDKKSRHPKKRRWILRHTHTLTTERRHECIYGHIQTHDLDVEEK